MKFKEWPYAREFIALTREASDSYIHLDESVLELGVVISCPLDGFYKETNWDLAFVWRLCDPILYNAFCRTQDNLRYCSADGLRTDLRSYAGNVKIFSEDCEHNRLSGIWEL